MITETEKNKGFTIVEIIFVLAIGGLILIMSFMAIASGQRSKRDAQRKADLSRINQNIVSWANNANGGIIPDLAASPPDNLVTAASPVPQTPNGGNYSITYNVVTTTCTTTNDIYYQRTSDRSYKIKICLESGDYTEEH